MAIDWEYYRKKAKELDKSNYDIATVAPSVSKANTDERKWFQKSALFDDGYDFGDVFKTILGSGTDVTENAGAGFIGTGEKIVDALSWLGTALNGQQMQTAAQNEMIYNTLAGNNISGKKTLENYDSFQKQVEDASAEFIKKDLYDEQAIAKKLITENVKKATGIDAETDSIFGEKSDELAQSAGQLGATVLANTIAPGSGLAMTGITTFGSEMESALNQGATYDEAAFSSAVSAGAEMLTEKLTGGIKLGGKALDDALTSKVTSSFSNGIVRKLVDLGMDAAGEGFEEILSGAMSAVGQKLSYMSDKEFNELFSSQDAWDSFIGGAVLGGLSSAGKNVKAKVNGVDSITGLTKSEQAVFDKVYKDRVAEAKKGGKKLSGKDKENIYNSVMNDIEKGYIGIDTIESVLGGETYKQYQSAVEKDNQMKELQKEYDTLYKTKLGEKSDEQNDRQKELKQQLDEYKNTSKLSAIQEQLSNEVSKLAKTSKLAESYNEKSRRSQAFEADLTQYDEKHQGTYKRAMESGVLNNTNRTHEFVDLLAKLEADKGVLFDFTNNTKLKESGFAIEGKQVNGYVQGNNVAINIDSTSALNKVVGHDITHVLEGTELYTELANVVKEFATAKGEYDSKLQSIAELYEDMENVNLENELTADLIGEYLFTDSDFVNRLSAEKPTLFQKIFDEIKYLYKTATAGSKEARQLEKVKKTFEEAYRQKNNTATDDGVKYSMAGVYSKTYDNSLALKAEQMLFSGVDSETVRQETGWYKGYDGEWRYEIDDSKCELIENPNLEKHEDEFVGTYFTGKVSDVLNHRDLFEAYPQLKDIKIVIQPTNVGLRGRYEGGSAKYITLNIELFKRHTTEYDDILKNSAAEIKNIEQTPEYKEYNKWHEDDDLLNMDAEEWLIEEDKAREKFYSSELGKRYYYLKWGRKNIQTHEFGWSKSAKEVLMHELQHAIQEIEGFTSGSSFEYWQGKLNSGFTIKTAEQKEELKNAEKEYRAIMKKDPYFFSAMEELVKSKPDVPRGKFNWDTFEKIEEDPIEWQRFDANREMLEEEYGSEAVMNFFRISDKLKNLRESSYTAEQAYFKTAGEVEARDTAQRLNLNAEQRKNTRPDIDRTDVVFAGDSGIGYSVEKTVVDSEGNQYNDVVKVNTDIFKGYKPRNWKTPLKNFVDNHLIGKKITIFNKDGESQTVEFAKPNERVTNESGNRRKVIDKLKQKNDRNSQIAVANIENLVEVSFEDSSITHSEENNHQWLDANGWDFRFAYMEMPNGKIYSVQLNIANTADGRKILYDINKISECGLDTMLVDETSTASQNSQFADKRIPQEQNNVKKNSLSNANDDVAPVGNGNVYGEDIKFQSASAEDIAPIGEDVIKTPTTEKSIIYGDEPIKESHSSTHNDLVHQMSDIMDETPDDITPIEQSAKITEKVEEKPKSKRFERAIRKINTQLEQDKTDLLEDFQQKKAELEKALENKTTYISDKSLSLYKELQNLRKGKRASNDLAYFLDLKLDWNELKSTLLKVHKWPDTVLNPESEIESIVREAIGRDFDEKSYELDDLDTEYQKQIEELDKKADEKRKKAGIAEQRRVKQQEYKSQMDELIGDTTTWKDKKLGVQYRVNTLRRNLRDIVRDKNGKRDLAKADAIYDELQGRYNHNEAELNREANKIKKVYADMNITKAEDTYIQMLGEYRHNPDTKLTLEEMQEFLEKNKDKIDQAKVDKIIDLARGTYDSLFGRVNAVLKEQGMREIPYRLGYFPHFTEEKQGRLAKLLNWKTQKNDIPTDIAGLTEQFNPNRSWQSFNKQRSGDDTDYSFMKGLDTYVQGSLDWIYHIEDIQKRRAFENHIRYVHSEKGIQEKIDAIYNNEEYDADEMQEQVDAVFKEAGNPLNNFVTDFRTQTNTLAGKKSSMDRNVEAMLNRDVYSTTTNISNRVTANMVVGSISSALTNFIPITQSWGEVSPISSLKAMKDTIKSTIQDDGTIDKSDFLTNRLRKNENLYQTTLDKVIDKAGFMMEAIDSFTSQTVWRSKYLENMSKGMSEAEAIKNADEFAEGLIAGRSRGNMPTIFDSKSPITKVFTAFQLEVNNQYGYMFKDMPQDMKNQSVAKLAKGYATMFIGAYAYNAAYSALTGRDAAFDPIRIIQELLSDLFDDEEDEPADVIMDFTDNIIDELPFVGGILGDGGRVPISSALPYGGIREAWEGSVTDFTEGNLENLTKEWLSSAGAYLLLPAGGGQIKKSVQGLSMFDDDLPIAGSYTDSGKLRFSVDETMDEMIKAGLFGQYASNTARQYFDEERAPLSDKQTKELVDLDIPIADYWKYRDGLKALGEDAELAEKVAYIADLEEFDIRQKNIMANNLTTRKDPIDLTDYDKYGDLEELDYAVKNPGKYAVSKAVGGYSEYVKYSEHLNNITSEKNAKGETVSGSRKIKVARYINNLDIDYGEKIILYRSQYKSDDTYNTQIIDYLNSRDDISREEMETILKELGFEVYADGTVRW